MICSNKLLASHTRLADVRWDGAVLASKEQSSKDQKINESLVRKQRFFLYYQGLGFACLEGHFKTAQVLSGRDRNTPRVTRPLSGEPPLKLRFPWSQQPKPSYACCLAGALLLPPGLPCSTSAMEVCQSSSNERVYSTFQATKLLHLSGVEPIQHIYTDDTSDG